MTVIPKKDTPLAARTDADFAQTFVRWADQVDGEAVDLTGWSFRFVVKLDEFADEALLEADDEAGIEIEDAAAGRLVVAFDKAGLLDAMPSEKKRLEAIYALQASGPGGADEVWAAGPFILIRGL